MDFTEALEKAGSEFKDQLHKMRFIKKMESRVDAVKMCFMRARDIERENNKDDSSYPTFTFTISTYNPEQMKWNRCPGCGDDKIDKVTNGTEWQGCFRCHILLDKNGIIRSMNPNKKKDKKQDKTPDLEFKTADELMEEK